jgi:uncharacterized protein (TIGR00251 family)
MTNDNSIPMRSSPEGVVLQVKVHPRARRNAVEGCVGEALKLAVTAPADQGKANQAVRELLAETFNLPVSTVAILSGLTSPRKVVRLGGLGEEEVRSTLQSVLGTGSD